MATEPSDPPPSYNEIAMHVQGMQSRQRQPILEQAHPGQPTPFQEQAVQAPMQPFMARPRPPYSGPHDFLPLAMMAAFVCGLFNLMSLSFGIPAAIFAMMSNHQKNKANYRAAKKYANGALIMIVASFMWTLSIACVPLAWFVQFISELIACHTND